jgi:amidase
MTGSDLEAYRTRSISMLCSAGLSGLPQVSMPVAEIEGLPFGISLLGAPDSELSLLALCRRMMELDETDRLGRKKPQPANRLRP